MITVTCTEKLRDKNGRIVGYELKDDNGNKMKFNSKQVKQAVFLRQITITNLKLTSGGRLIDTQNTDITYENMAHALNKLLKKYTYKKHAHKIGLSRIDVDDIIVEATIIRKHVAGTVFDIDYSDNRKSLDGRVEAILLTVCMYSTKNGYSINVITYRQGKPTPKCFNVITGEQIDCSTIVVGFNDDLTEAMKKIDLIMYTKFNNALNEVKELAKDIERPKTTLWHIPFTLSRK